MTVSKKIATAYLELGVDGQRMRRDLANTKRQTSIAMKDITTAIGTGLASFGLLRFIQFGVKVSKEAEVAAIGFEVLTGSVEQATKTIAELKSFSDVTPFTGKEVQSAGKQLLAAGVDVDSLTARLEILGNASAAVDARLNEVVAVFAKVRGAGKLTGETFLQFSERAINLGPALAKNMGVAESEIRDLISAGKVTTKEVVKAFETMSASGGLFEGAMEKLSRSLEGRLSTLQTRFADVARTIGDIVAPVLKLLVETAISAIDAFLALPGPIKAVVGGLVALSPLVLGAVAAFNLLKASGIGAAIGIRAAFAATGIGILIPIIGMIINGLMSIEGMGEGLTQFFENLRAPIERLWVSIKSIANSLFEIFMGVINSIMGSWGFSIDSMTTTFSGFASAVMGKIVSMLEAFANFVARLAAWARVIADNQTTAWQIVAEAGMLAVMRIKDVFSNLPETIFQYMKFVVENVIHMFGLIPKAWQDVVLGGMPLGDFIAREFEIAVNKSRAQLTSLAGTLFKESPESKQAAALLKAKVKGLSMEVEKLLNQKAEFKKAEAEDKDEPDTANTDDGGKGLKAGSTGLTNFRDEVQKLFLDKEGDDAQVKILTAAELSNDIQKKMLDELKKGNKKPPGNNAARTDGR